MFAPREEEHGKVKLDRWRHRGLRPAELLIAEGTVRRVAVVEPLGDEGVWIEVWCWDDWFGDRRSVDESGFRRGRAKARGALP